MKADKKVKHQRELSQGLPAIENNAVNQTIIINNPNFNINYIEHPAYNLKNYPKPNHSKVQELPAYDPKNSSKGIDAWNLNKNLKQFSQTRQLGFFKGNPTKTRSNSELHNSPYLIHKTKTNNQIKPYHKIAPVNTNSFRENRTISTIKNQQTITSKRQKSNLSLNHPSIGTIESNDDSKTSFRRRKFETKPRNAMTINQQGGTTIFQPYLNKTIKLNQTITNNGSKTQRVQRKANLTRRNKFTNVQQNQGSIQINTTKNATLNKSQNQEEQQCLQDLQNQLVTDLVSPPKKIKSSNQHTHRDSHKRSRRFQKSIQRISQCFLAKVDNYFDNVHNNQISSAKIQVYATTAQLPNKNSHSMEYKSSAIVMAEGLYDFKFEGETPKVRPKTPYKRKKMYEQA